MKNIEKKEETKKNYTPFKIIAVMALIFVVMACFVKSAYFQDGQYLESSSSTLFGIGGLVGYAIPMMFYHFGLQTVFLLSVGGLYGILSRTSGYKAIVDKIGKWVEKHKVVAVLVISLIFALLTSIINDVTILFLFIPFAISVLTKGKVDKIVAFCTTFGSIFVGMVGPTIAGYGVGDLYEAMNVDYGSNRLVQILVLMIAYALLNLFSIMRVKNQGRKAELVEDTYEVEEKSNKISAVPIMVLVLAILATFIGFGLSKYVFDKSSPMLILGLTFVFTYLVFFVLYFWLSKAENKRKWPLIVGLVSLVFIILLGYVNWSQVTESTIFTDYNNWLTKEVTITVEETSDLGVTTEVQKPILGYLIGSTSEFGNLGIYVAIIYVVLFAIFIGLSCKFNFNEILSYFFDGAKRIAGPVAIFLFAKIITVCSSGVPIINNMVYKLTNITSEFNVYILILVALVGIILSGDISFFVAHVGTYLGTIYAGNASTAALIVSTIFGYGQFILPTGILLLAGLSYCKIGYGEWFKYIWKYLLGLLAILVILFLIF